MAKPKISIVVCTHRRVNLLKGAVQSLIEQSVSSASYEVIVVDNDIIANQGVKKIVEEARKHISIRYMNEKRVGLSYARNAGGKIARSDYVGYIDDDARANPKYIETLLQIISAHKPDICGGPYYPFYLDHKPKWFLDRYGADSKGNKPHFLTSREYLSGMNIIFRRNILDELGWFNPHLGMTGKNLWYGEETMVQIKAWNSYPGLKVYYHPKLFVHHLVPARKMSVWNRMRMAYQIGKCQVYFWIPETEHKKARSHAPWHLVNLVLRLLGKILPGIIFCDRKKYPFWQNYVYEKLSGYIGLIGGQLRLTTDLFFPWTADSS